MITVVFATHNGAETLPKMLDSMSTIESPENGWKLIAVDNASGDATPEILKSFAGRLPLQTLFQPRRGKNASLNIAIPHFEGDLIVFTDDDVLPMQNWLTAYEELAATHPDISVFGGRVVPHWPGDRPDAIIQSIPLGPAFAIHTDNLQDGPVNPGMIWGPNMAIKSHIFNSGYHFNEDVGPSSGNYIMGSEVDFTHRLHNAGFLNWFSNEIVVRHQILHHQLTRKWLWNRAIRFGKGRFAARLKKNTKESDIVDFCGLPRWRVWEFLKDLMSFPVALLKKDETHYLKLFWRIGENYSVLSNMAKHHF